MSTNLEPSASPPVESLLLSADKVAALLDISERSLWRLRSAGAIPQPVRLGGSVRWRREDILEWMAQGCPRGTSRENGRRR